MQCWDQIAKLKGQALKTLDHGHGFEILDVRPNSVILRVSTGKERRIRRIEIEPAFTEMAARYEITRVDIHKKYSERNPAYVAAILASLPGVTHTKRPIHLRYTKATAH
jgi:hypothetical protein